jgi:hypothetical protein
MFSAEVMIGKKTKTQVQTKKILCAFLFLLRRCGGFGLFREQCKRGGVLHRNVRQYFAIEIHAGGLQAMNQLTVGDAVEARGSADALNPQAAILALFDAAIAECIAIGAIRGFLRGLVELALGEKKTFCTFEILLTPRTAFGAAFYAWHLRFSLVKWEATGCANAQEHAYGNGFVSGMNYFRAMFRREAKAFAANRPAGTREALPGSNSSSFSAGRCADLRPTFIATASASMR